MVRKLFVGTFQKEIMTTKNPCFYQPGTLRETPDGRLFVVTETQQINPTRVYGIPIESFKQMV